MWLGVLGSIRERITTQQFETWFRGVRPLRCTAETIELTVANPFSKEWLRKKYAEIILRAAEKVTGGRRPTLKIRVREPEEGRGGAGSAVSRLEVPSLAGGEVASGPQAAAEPAKDRRPPAPEVSASPSSNLNPAYRFDTFVTGSSNRLGVAAARSIAEGRTKGYNPLYIHGGIGLGKTHLLQSIAHAINSAPGSRRALYVSCEEFLNHFISAVERQELDAFRRRYRRVDVLIVDDVHLLSQKERTQEEFLHTFNHLYESGRQIVLAGDAEPGCVPFLAERLVSRFRWGLVCPLEAPEISTRLGIAQAKAEALGARLPDEVLRFIAENVRASVRELEGAVTRVVGHASLAEVPPSLELARDVLKDVVSANRRHVSVDDIVAVVTERFGVRLAELQSKRRTQSIVVPRQLCMYLVRRLTGNSLEAIGGYFGGRDHSTVHYALNRVEGRLKKDPGFQALSEEILQAIMRKVEGS